MHNRSAVLCCIIYLRHTKRIIKGQITHGTVLYFGKLINWVYSLLELWGMTSEKGWGPFEILAGGSESFVPWNICGAIAER